MEISTLTPVIDWIGAHMIEIIIGVFVLIWVFTKKFYPMIWLHKLHVMLMTKTTEAMMWLSVSTTPLEWYVLTKIAEAKGDSIEEAGARIAIACMLEIIGSFLFGLVMQPSIGFVAKDGKITWKEWFVILLIALIAWTVGLYFTTGVFNIYLSVEFNETMTSFWQVLFAPTGKMFTGIENGIPYHIWYSIYATPIVSAASLLIIFIRFVVFHKILKGDLKNIFHVEVEVYESIMKNMGQATPTPSPTPSTSTPSTTTTPPAASPATITPPIANDSGSRMASAFLNDIQNP